MSEYGPNDIPLKTAVGASLKDATTARLPANLYQLLVMINGTRSVRELLHLGIGGTSIDSFDELYRLRLIEGAKSSTSRRPLPIEVTARPIPSRKGLAEARFAVLDILLDLSEKDFGARPWIEKIEQVADLARLSAEVEAFCASPFGRKHPNVHDALRRAAGS